MRRKMFFYAMLVITVIVLVTQILSPLKNNNITFGETVDINTSGIVTEVEQKDLSAYQFVIETDDGKILGSYYQKLNTPWSLIGTQITFRGALSAPAKAGNPRTFDYSRYLLSKGILYTCAIESFAVQETSSSLYLRIKRTIVEKRETYMRSLLLDKTAEGLLRGLLFGDKHQMDETVYDAFRKNGTAHVLAVSGLHVGMLYSIYRWIYDRWKRRWLTTAFLCFLFIYGTASLWSPSVTRAVGLIVLVVLGRMLHRRYDLLTALSAMALAAVLKNPYIVFSAGFQMSFLAVLSITFLQKPFTRYVGEKWAAAFAVQTGLLPYMAYTFNYISFVGIACNVPVIFLSSILVPLGMTGFMIYFLCDAVIPGFPQILEAVTNLMVWCNGLFVSDGILSFDVISPPLWSVILLYGLMFLVASEYFHIYFHRRDWRKIWAVFSFILAATVMGIFIDCTPFDRAELVFVDVGQGDCLHVKTPDDRQVLIDGGGRFGYNTGEKTLKPYLLKNRIREIDLAAATHLHTDHYTGLEELAACYPVNQILTQGQAGQRISLGKDYWLEILWPKTQNPETDDENENSLIFMVHHNGLKTLITGDITAEGEKMLLDTYRGTQKLQADILKIAHHGSPYSTSDVFLKEVNPKVAVISVGKNHYGHPSDIVIEKLEQRGIIVFRTDQDGAVGIINRKGRFSVCTEKQR